MMYAQNVMPLNGLEGPIKPQGLGHQRGVVQAQPTHHLTHSEPPPTSLYLGLQGQNLHYHFRGLAVTKGLHEGD